MGFQLLIDKFKLYELSMAKAKFTSLTNEILFKDFPQNLPPQINELWYKSFGSVLKNARPESDSRKAEPVTGDFLSFLHPSVILLKGAGSKQLADSFEQACFQHELIAYFSLTEGLFSEMQRIVYTIENPVSKFLKVNKWETIFEFQAREEIIRNLVEDRIAKIKVQDIDQLMMNFNEPPFNLNLNISDGAIAIIKEFKSMRDSTIYNACKCQDEHVSPVTGQVVYDGDEYKMDRIVMDKLFEFLLDTAYHILFAVAAKYFHKTQGDLYEEFHMAQSGKIDW